MKNLFSRFLSRNLLWLSIISFFATGITFSQTEVQRPLDPFNAFEKCSRANHETHYKSRGIKKEISPASFQRSTSNITQFQTASKSSAICTSGLAGWASLSPGRLVTELKSVYDYQACFTGWYRYHASYSPIIFSNRNIEAVARAMYNISLASDGTYKSGMLGLVAYLHAAMYNEFNQSTITINTNSRYWIRLASESFANNAHLFDLTNEALTILDEYLIVLDYDGIRSRPKVISVFKNVMRRLAVTRTWSTITDNKMLRNYARAHNRVFFAIFRGNLDNDFKKAIDGDADFFNLLYQIGISDILNNKSEFNFMTKNAVTELSRMANTPILVNDVENLLAEIAKKTKRLSVKWLRAINAINKYGNCTRYNLCENVSNLKKEIENKLFPKNYSFDDGKMKIKTPLGETKVQGLYHAAKQVQNQFFRLIQTDQPVAGDVNESLNMVVFGSKKEYEDYATYLYNIPTNNGGMYIERRSTFYTWDRTVGVESSLSLESLFRHEYVHYLQGRYLIPGYWDETDMYKGNRMVWYEEGMAEFFSGSTDVNGIKPLASNVRIVKSAAKNWPTLNTVFNSSYSSGNFFHYYYGNMAWYNWYVNDFGKLKTFFDLTRSNNVKGFDNLVNSLRTSGQRLYSRFLNDVNNGIILGKEPTTDWLASSKIAIGNTNDIKTEFTALTGNANITVGIDATKKNRRFKITGRIEGTTATTNNTNGVKQLNTVLDNLLKSLRGNQLLNNFQYTVAYFKNMDLSNGVPKADFVISGPLRDENVNNAPIASFSAGNTITIEGGKIQFHSQSQGYLDNITWSFPGGNPTKVVNVIKPEITYNTAGVYNVSLTANAKNGQSNVKKEENFIKVYAKNTATYCAASGTQNSLAITNVSFGSINNSSSHNKYGDYTSKVTELEIGKEKTLTIKVNNSHWTGNAIGAWIDWNKDGDFNDQGEKVFSAFRAGPYVSKIVVPNNAVSGTTTMRIRAAYGGTDKIKPCGVDKYIGEVEDYSVVITGKPAQVIAPIADFTASSTVIKKGQSITYTNASKNFPTSLSWSFTGGSPSTSTDNTPVITYNTPGVYEVSLTATNSAGSNTKKVTKYITVLDVIEYCKPTTALNHNIIRRVQFSNINQSSNWVSNGYSDYSNGTEANVNKGTSYGLTVETKFSHWSGIDVQAWIDWNLNGSFEANERVYHKRGTGPFTTQVAIPATASVGKARLRVRLAYGKTPGACDRDGYQGETEDYTINVNGANLLREVTTSKADDFTVYPNPSLNKLVNIYLNKTMDVGSILRLIDLQGREVKKELINESGINSIRMNLNEIPSGIYIIQLENKGNTQTKKLILK